MDGGTSPWETSSVLKTNGGQLTKHLFTTKTGNQNIQPVRFWYKNANAPTIITVWARAKSTNHGLRHFPWTFTRGWVGEGGGTKVKYPVPHELARSGADDVTLRMQEAFQGVWSDFRHLPKSATLWKPWAIAQAFCQNRPISDPCEITRNPHEQSRKLFELYL